LRKRAGPPVTNPNDIPITGEQHKCLDSVKTAQVKEEIKPYTTNKITLV